MEATAAQRDATAAAEMAVHPTQPLLHPVLQERPGPRWVQLHRRNIPF